jgi:hypothetical protein
VKAPLFIFKSWRAFSRRKKKGTGEMEQICKFHVEFLKKKKKVKKKCFWRVQQCGRISSRLFIVYLECFGRVSQSTNRAEKGAHVRPFYFIFSHRSARNDGRPSCAKKIVGYIKKFLKNKINDFNWGCDFCSSVFNTRPRFLGKTRTTSKRHDYYYTVEIWWRWWI